MARSLGKGLGLNRRSGQSWSQRWAPLNEFKTDQSTLTQLIIQRITVLPGKSVLIDWGDETTTELTGENLNITKDYSVEGQYDITLSGDLDSIEYWEWMGAYGRLYGDFTGKRLPIALKWFHFYYNDCSGDLSIMFKYLPTTLQIFHVGKSGSVQFTGSVDNIKWPATISDIHLEGNLFTGNPFRWELPSPFVPDQGHINLAGNNFIGTGYNWTLPEGVSWIRMTSPNVVINLADWVLPSTLGSIYLRGSGAYGNIEDWVLPTTVRDNEGFQMDFEDLNITGDLSSWLLPNDGGVGALLYNVLNMTRCNITKMPRGAFRHFKTLNFNGCNCNEAEVDAFLAAVDAYFDGGVVPLTNCTYNLAGAGMSAPSAAGLASRTSIINKYVAAGKVATINYYVAIADPTNLTITTNPAHGQSGVTLGWTDNSGGYALYEIWESINGGEYSLIHTTAAGVQTYARSIVINTSVSYRVRGVDAMTNATEYLTKTATLGSELVDQSAWKTAPVSSYWDKYSSANWSADGTKLTSNGSNGTLGRDSFWTTGKLYKVILTITRTSGAVVPPYSTGHIGGQISSQTYNMTGGVQTWLAIYSSVFNGTITGLSIKEIVIT